MRGLRVSKDMVPDGVWELMPPDPQLAALKAERAQLKSGQKHSGKRSSEKLTGKTTFTTARPGTLIPMGKKRRNTLSRQSTCRFWSALSSPEILCNQPNNLSSAELLELRIQAADLIAILCGKRETMERNRIRRRVQANATVKDESPGPDPFPLLVDRTQCLRCIGDETRPHREKTFKYSRPAVMYDHFDRKHRQQLGGVK
ncbi:FluG domain-containing protein [Triangularia setosa]|uniref:FluG domain-containing protein n=1 Tax=Triangularia setosa TaxID=2587417 RepID=A0AAN7A6M9_9PEZI|nr:FluG domain-containing protein [Podospora setosa]